jgi:Bacterial regulatory protein, Fis family
MEMYQEDYQGLHGTWLKRWVPVPEPVPLYRVVRSALLNALAYTAGNQEVAARYLGITPRVMSYQMAAHNIPGAGHGDQQAAAVRGRRYRKERMDSALQVPLKES